MTRNQKRKFYQRYGGSKSFPRVVNSILKQNGFSIEGTDFEKASRLEKLAGIETLEPGSDYSSPKYRLIRVVPLVYVPNVRKSNTKKPVVRKIKPIKKQLQPKVVPDRTKQFYKSYDWSKLRYKVLQKYGRKCMCCGNTPENGSQIHVDHIKPLRLHWKLRLNFDNMQVLCGFCNRGKGNWDETDWREKPKVKRKRNRL